MVVGEVELLARNIDSMDEPWRGRFLTLVANYATKWAWDGNQPTQEEVTAWLRSNPALYQWVRSLISVWQGPEIQVNVQIEGRFNRHLLR